MTTNVAPTFNPPPELTYSTLRPEGLPSRQIEVRYKPSTQQVINPGETFQFNITSNGWLEPWSTFINIEVDFSSLPDHVIAQIDGSASSFIRSYVAFCRGVELERINEYDVLANALADCKLPIHRRATHTHEGMGFGNYSDSRFGKLENGMGWKQGKIIAQPNFFAGANQTQGGAVSITGVTYGIGGTHPLADLTVVALATTSTNVWAMNAYGAWADIYWGVEQRTSLPGSRWISENILFADKQMATFTAGVLPASWRATVTAAISYPELTQYNASNYYLLASADKRQKIVSEITGIVSCYGAGVNVGQALFALQGRDGVEVLLDTDIANGGCLKQMFNYSLSNGNWEPMFTNGKASYYIPNSMIPIAQQVPLNSEISLYQPGSSSIPSGAVLVNDILRQYQRPMIAAGKFGRQNCSTGYFSIPLFSGLFGQLMPSTSYKLIPMRAFQNLTLEFIVSQWGIFTSGYCNSNTNSSTNQPQRAFQITSIELVTQQFVFPAETEAAILANYNSGQTLYIHSHSFVLGPMQTIVKNAIPGTVSINYGFDSLKAILACFIPQDFQNYSWCRRNYRISMNLTKFQAKIGLDYYPQLGQFANGGNVAPLTTASTLIWRKPNNEFIIGLQKCFDMYQDVASSQLINSQNFAPNDRPYAPDNSQANTGTNYDSMGYLYQECFNQYGWPLVHENRCRAQALYGLDLEALQKNATLLSGVNTVTTKPFDLILDYESDAPSLFNRNANMYIFLWYDFLVAFSNAGLSIVGKS